MERQEARQEKAGQRELLQGARCMLSCCGLASMHCFDDDSS